ncbi:sugar phosphate isomerase/epimerase [Oceanobacillus oncorhynchi subsp. oncorhynchi]|uniref:sugar phosphate isomerase/epimerase family protein n=1 Tax=Oceanobacillus oncorhynchi TaxID=545501 RepID=UPI0031D78AED
MLEFAYAFQTKETRKQLLSAKGSESTVIPTLADIGYDGVELLVRQPKDANLKYLFTIMERHDLKVASIGTGPMVADDGLSFTSKDAAVREEAIQRTLELVVWAQEVGTSVSIGKLRGQLSSSNPTESWKLMKNAFGRILEEADRRKVMLLVEPQNRTQLNNLNKTSETLAFIDMFNTPYLGIMLDILHIEAEKEESSTAELINEAYQKLGYMHLTDSERLIPGDGDYDLETVINTFRKFTHKPFIGLEIKQQDKQLDTARKALAYLQSLI